MKMSKADNLVFQRIFLLNSLKHKFFPLCIVNVKFSTYFHMKTKILPDFRICISLPLRAKITVMFIGFDGKYTFFRAVNSNSRRLLSSPAQFWKLFFVFLFWRKDALEMRLPWRLFHWDILKFRFQLKV